MTVATRLAGQAVVGQLVERVRHLTLVAPSPLPGNRSCKEVPILKV